LVTGGVEEHSSTLVDKSIKQKVPKRQSLCQSTHIFLPLSRIFDNFGYFGLAQFPLTAVFSSLVLKLQKDI
jgi:hypothetical protein